MLYYLYFSHSFYFLGVSHYFLDFPSFLASYNYLKK
ncbi:hypothetical protein HPHPP11_1356, partial [Helicobacter pylori Hp P-11]